MKIIENVNEENLIQVQKKNENIILFMLNKDDEKQKDLFNKIKEIKTDKYLLVKIETNNKSGSNIALNLAVKSLPAIYTFEKWNIDANILWEEQITKFINVLKFNK